MELSEGKTERLKCNAYYTGGGSRLGVAIRCQSEISNIEFRSKLSQTRARAFQSRHKELRSKACRSI
jgi:hypothetical protein